MSSTTTTMGRSSSHGLQGPRPKPLSTSPNSSPKKRPRPGPVVMYLRSPDIIHVAPEEFKGLVQRLTGNCEPARPKSLLQYCPPPLDPHQFHPNSSGGVGNDNTIDEVGEFGVPTSMDDSSDLCLGDFSSHCLDHLPM